MSWHPVDALDPVEWLLPKPGTDRPYAVIRRVCLTTPDGPVEAFRVLAHAEPRKLIRDGYYGSLSEAALAGYSHAVDRVGSGVLSDMDAYKREGRGALPFLGGYRKADPAVNAE